MKRQLFLAMIAASLAFTASAQDTSMNKKMQNKTDKMNKKMENKTDKMNKKVEDRGEKIDRKKADTSMRKSTPSSGAPR